MPVVSPPRLVGTRSVAALLGISPVQVSHRVRADHPLTRPGYLGKIGGRHVWNIHELIASLFTSDAAIDLVVDRLTDRDAARPDHAVLCSAGGCDRVEEMVGLCRVHLRHLMTAWDRAERSSLVVLQLVAMCRWVSERNAHLVLPPGFDPWSAVCMTPDCGNPTNVHGPDGWHGPLCPECSDRFWNNPPGRDKPAWWKRTRRAA